MPYIRIPDGLGPMFGGSVGVVDGVVVVVVVGIGVVVAVYRLYEHMKFILTSNVHLF